MKRVLGAVVLLSMFTAVSACDEDPTGPSEESVTFTAQLSPANEVPAVSNAEATGSGVATIVMDITRNDVGVITAAVVDFQIALNGFPVNTPVTMAHIHTGAAGANGGILVDTGVTAGEVLLATGTGGFTRNGITGTRFTPEMARDIIANPAGFYFNVHSVLNPGGMARGQLVKQ